MVFLFYYDVISLYVKKIKQIVMDNRNIYFYVNINHVTSEFLMEGKVTRSYVRLSIVSRHLNYLCRRFYRSREGTFFM